MRSSHKKRAGRQALLQKLCRPYLPQKFDLILIDGVTLLVRVGLVSDEVVYRWVGIDEDATIADCCEIVGEVFGVEEVGDGVYVVSDRDGRSWRLRLARVDGPELKDSCLKVAKTSSYWQVTDLSG